MKKTYTHALYVFRRDLRIFDNTALHAATQMSAYIIPLFIFDPHQVEDDNRYRSTNAIQFMITSLAGLADAIAQQGGMLHIAYGDPCNVVESIITHYPIDAVFMNGDYTPFSVMRDTAIAQICKKKDCDFYSFHDVMLNPPNTVLTKSGTPYGVFTPYWKAASTVAVRPPASSGVLSWKHMSVPHQVELTAIAQRLVPHPNAQIRQQGGRAQGLKILQRINNQKHYVDTRDFPAQSTTELSAHIKFGTLSIREVYYHIAETLGKGHALLRQLYWHDFWVYIAYHNPQVYGHAYRNQFDALPWNNDKKMFHAWCTGQTGFPIVDAGMRELNATGYMHNRVRMIVASFLTKDLHINWQWGEQYFAKQLVDYDPAVNNGNWQWSASTGCDAQPYFRIFNPWLQQKKFDEECTYIKKWVPELRTVSPAIIHNWYNPAFRLGIQYDHPIVDHAVESSRAKKVYAHIAKQ